MNADTSISVILKSAGFMLPESGRESYIRNCQSQKMKIKTGTWGIAGMSGAEKGEGIESDPGNAFVSA